MFALNIKNQLTHDTIHVAIYNFVMNTVYRKNVLITVVQGINTIIISWSELQCLRRL